MSYEIKSSNKNNITTVKSFSDHNHKRNGLNSADAFIFRRHLNWVKDRLVLDENYSKKHKLDIKILKINRTGAW